jgi:hypothetical protein
MPEAAVVEPATSPAETPKESPKEAPKAAPKEAAADDWGPDLPEDLRKTAERFTSKADALRAIVALQKREGHVRVPGKNATEEEISAYRKAVGIPEKAEEYEFSDLPEGQDLNDEIKTSRQEWGKRFHELSIPKESAKALSKMVSDDQQKYLAAQVEADKAFAKAQEEALRNEWKGPEFEKNKTLANRAFAEVANRAGLKIEDLTKIETKDGRFLLDRAEIVKLFSIIGREMDEGTLGPTLTESERETLGDQIRDVRKQIADAQSDGDSRRANQLYQKEQNLIAKTKGNKPIIGSQGRIA